MKKSHPLEEEVPYDVSDLFFSITDKKGLINSFNPTFPRISGYSDAELFSQPHNIIRHQDMPKSVFKYFWDCLKKNENVIAYVKNMAKDGRYYWVLAYVFPTKNGYLSIRMKPTSTILAKHVIPLYKKLKDQEDKNSLDDSVAFLLDSIKSLGFLNYGDFASKSLVVEINSKIKILSERANGQGESSLLASRFGFIGRELLDLSHTYVNVMSTLDKVDSDTVLFKESAIKILKTCNQLRYLVINMSISAKKMGVDGLIFSEISQWFERFSESIYLNVKDFESSMNEVILKIINSRLSIACSSLKVDMSIKYVTELARDYGKDKSVSQNIFDQLSLLISETKIGANIDDITLANRDIKKYGREVKNLDANIIGLEVIRITGKIESASSDAASDIFSHHLQMINEYIKNVRGSIAQITNTIESLDESTRSIEALTKVITFNIDKINDQLNDVKSELKHD